MNEEETIAESSTSGSNEKIEKASNKRKRDDTEDKSGTAKRCCARCRNHESDDIELKGHKNYCPWRDCICEPCIRTVVRQKLMADQTASRRKRHEMERRQEAGLPIIVPTVNQLKRLKTVADCGVVSFTPRAKAVVSSPAPGGASNLPKLICDVPEPKEVSWEAITELMHFFNFNVNTSALLYLILKYTSNNVKAACSIILNAKEDIKKISNKALSTSAAPLYPVNQLEAVPVFVVPSEKVLDLSYQPGLGYPATPAQPYTYPSAAGPPPCFQPFRQPTWPHPTAPPQLYELTSYPENERNQSMEDFSSYSARRSPSLYSPEEESAIKPDGNSRPPDLKMFPNLKMDKSTVPLV